jgi:hypothetical protein
MMYKSASETTLKTSSFPTGTDNTDYSRQDAEIRDAVAQALRWLEQGHDFILETQDLFDLDLETNAGMLQLDLLALEKAHHLTGHGTNDVEWAYGVLAPTRTEEAATPAVMIFLRTLPSGTTAWKIPEEIHTRDLLPHYASLAKRVAIRDARLALYDRWDAEEKAAQAAAGQRALGEAYGAACLAKRQEEDRAALAAWRATPEYQQRTRELEQLRLPEEPEEAEEEKRAAEADKEARAAVMDITGLPGMAETAGLFANTSALHGMSVAEAVQAAITHLWVWDWATPAALAKREAARKQAQADAAEKEAKETFMAITGRPGMAEAAGWQAHDAVSRHGLSAAEAVQQAIRSLSMWTWATPEARAKRDAEEKAKREAEEHDPVLERLIAESKAIREAPLSAFAAEAGLEEDEESLPNMDEL